MEIHLEGYLGRDYDGILGLSETKTDDEWEYKSIVDSLETLADEKGAKYRFNSHGKKLWLDLSHDDFFHEYIYE